mgnify:CR=1 FL=1
MFVIPASTNCMPLSYRRYRKGRNIPDIFCFRQSYILEPFYRKTRERVPASFHHIGNHRKRCNRIRQNKNHLSYVYPKAGSTVLVFYDYDVPSEKLCSYLYNTTGTLITPGDIFNVPHSFRISYACDHRQLLSGLVCLSEVCEKLNNNPHFLDDINP